jgi:hypothetical protein
MKSAASLANLVAIGVALGVVLAGCPDPEPIPDPEPVPVVNADYWVRVVDASLDVFADQRPPDAVCDDTGWGIDIFQQSIEVYTDVCDYPTLSQPSLEPIEPGDVVNVLAFHYTLTAPEPSEGYMAIAIDGEIVWEVTAAIPSDAEVFDQSFTAERSFPLGSEVQFHVHNHGPNTWELVSVMVTHAQ